MNALENTIKKAAQGTGIRIVKEFDPRMLTPEARIRAACRKNRCGNYRKNYMCPPHIGALKAVRKRLKPYTAGFLLQFVEEMDVKNDLAGILRTRAEFHRAILDMEKTLRGQGVLHPWGLIGGDCNLCQPCKAVSDEPCPFPEQARPSLEALGVNVLALLETLGMDNRFHEDRITWTGCILFVR